nr:hypothetical protein [Tanacetum cinerariifolium]
MGRDTVQLETAVSTISQDYLLEFTSEYGISEALHLELPGPGERIVDSPRVRVFPTIVDWRTSALKDEIPVENTYSPEAVMILNTHRIPIHKQPEALLRLVRLSRRYFLGDEVYGLVQFDPCSKPYQEMEDPTAATDSSGVLSTIERSHPDFANENPSQQSTGPEDQGQEAVAPKVPPLKNATVTGVTPKVGQAEGIAATGPHVIKERRKRDNDGFDANAPPKVLRKDPTDSRPTQNTHGGKSLAAIGLEMGSTRPVLSSRGVPMDVSDLDPLSFADPQSSKGAATVGDLESKNTSFTSMVRSPESIYRPEWGVTNGCLFDAPKACQDLVDHIAPPRYFSELRHLHNDDFLKQYNVNLARQMVMGSQLRLRFDQEAKPLKKSVAQVARRDKRIQDRENEIKNLETLLEAETDMKKAAEGKSAELSKELENLQAQFSDIQVSNNRLSQQVSALLAQIIGEENLKAAFKEFKQYEDNRVEKRCAEIDARLDALSIDFDEELYLHMLTAIAGRRWVIGHGLRLAVMKYVVIAKGMGEELKLLGLQGRDIVGRCRVVCRIHGVGSAHYAKSDGVPVSVPTVAPQGLAILLADVATQTEISEDEASPRFMSIWVLVFKEILWLYEYYLELAQPDNNTQLSSAFKTFFERETLSGANFNHWYRSLRIVLRVADTYDYLYKPCPDQPLETAFEEDIAARKAEYKKHIDVACLRLEKMSPALQKQFESYHP